MAGFLYFVEGEPRNAIDIIADHGLGHALESTCVLSPITLGATPSGNAGCILDDPKRHESSPCYRVDQQTWQRLGDLWVGYWKDDPPKPSDLERASLIPGYEIELGDGNLWRVPLARQYVRTHEQNGTFGSQLPHKLAIDQSGQWTMGPVVDRYATVWKLSIGFFDLWHAALLAAIESGDDSFVFDYDAPQHTAITVLSENYAISDIEASLIGLLLSDDTAGKIMRAACDCDLALLWMVEAKKNEQAAAGSIIDDGVEDSSATTPQLVQT